MKAPKTGVHIPSKGKSPLSMLVNDERTNRLLEKLSRQLDALRGAHATQDTPPILTLSTTEIELCREHWERGVLQGEHRLYDLAMLLTWRLTCTHKIQHVARVVVGPKEEEEDRETARIVIEEQITPSNLKRVTDYSLAKRVARHYRYRARFDAPFGKLYARASFLECRPLAMADEALATRVLTRVKTNDQIWNKVCDALFNIDAVIQRDKILNTRSKYIKDVFGIKILTPRRQDSYAVHEALTKMTFSPHELQSLGADFDPSTAALKLLEHKDYVNVPKGAKKRTGWEALKNVHKWHGQLFEVQIQTEANHFLEALHLTDTSHRTFEMQRRSMRRDLEAQVPHYRHMRRLLKFLFQQDSKMSIDDQPAWLRIV